MPLRKLPSFRPFQKIPEKSKEYSIRWQHSCHVLSRSWLNLIRLNLLPTFSWLSRGLANSAPAPGENMTEIVLQNIFVGNMILQHVLQNCITIFVASMILQHVLQNCFTIFVANMLLSMLYEKDACV